MNDPLSDLEVLALAALVRMGPDAYGVSIRDEILGRTGRTVSVGSLYKALHRLEKRGLTDTTVGEPSSVRGGRAKKLVQVTAEGREALDRAIAAYERMFEGLGQRVKPS